ERDDGLAGLPEAPERLAEQREPETAPAPPLPHAERPDPAPVAVPLGVVQRDRGDLVAVPDDGDERGVDPRDDVGALAPDLVGLGDVAPFAHERLLDCGVHRASVALDVERAELDA